MKRKYILIIVTFILVAGVVSNTTYSKGKVKVIVIDPGHANHSNLKKEPIAPNSSILKIKDGGGAAGNVTGVPEYKINMDVALKLKTYLSKMGYKAVMTKDSNSKSIGNVERAEVGNKNNAALVIRIHADSSESSSVKGASMLVPALNNPYMKINKNLKETYKKSKNYGSVILNKLVSEVGMKNRGVVERNDMTGFNWSKVPVVLVEMGFLSNRDEEKLLSSEKYKDKIARALADGIKSCVK